MAFPAVVVEVVYASFAMVTGVFLVELAPLVAAVPVSAMCQPLLKFKVIFLHFFSFA